MALVNCTKEIHTYVCNKIDEMFKDRYDHAYKLRGMTAGDIAREVYDRIHTPERLQMIKEMEKDVGDEFKLLYDVNEIHFDVNIPPVQRKISVKWSTTKPQLTQFAGSYSSPVIRHLSPEATTALIEAKDRHAAVKKDHEEFKEAFKKAYASVKSVNELVKLWPAVVELLPEGTMERIERKNGPRSKAAPAFDAAALNVQLLKAKVAK